MAPRYGPAAHQYDPARRQYITPAEVSTFHQAVVDTIRRSSRKRCGRKPKVHKKTLSTMFWHSRRARWSATDSQLVAAKQEQDLSRGQGRIYGIKFKRCSSLSDAIRPVLDGLAAITNGLTDLTDDRVYTLRHLMEFQRSFREFLTRWTKYDFDLWLWQGDSGKLEDFYDSGFEDCEDDYENIDGYDYGVDGTLLLNVADITLDPSVNVAEAQIDAETTSSAPPANETQTNTDKAPSTPLIVNDDTTTGDNLSLDSLQDPAPKPALPAVNLLAGLLAYSENFKNKFVDFNIARIFQQTIIANLTDDWPYLENILMNLYQFEKSLSDHIVKRQTAEKEGKRV